MRLIDTFGEVLPLLVVAFVVAALISLLITPLVRRLAIRLDNIDLPDQRRVNKRPIPRGGGIGVAIAFLVVAGGVLFANDRLALVPMPRSIDPTELVALLAGGAIATLIGVLDDTLQLRARWQLLGQVALAAFAVWPGSRSRSSTTRSGPRTSSSSGPTRSGSRWSGSSG